MVQSQCHNSKNSRAALKKATSNPTSLAFAVLAVLADWYCKYRIAFLGHDSQCLSFSLTEKVTFFLPILFS
jgi:hypothetical protein